VTEAANYEDITERVVVAEGETYLLPPGQSCLGITIENVKIAPHLCGLLGMINPIARIASHAEI
jgi:deoxycytidine triphosphate deaminase